MCRLEVQQSSSPFLSAGCASVSWSGAKAEGDGSHGAPVGEPVLEGWQMHWWIFFSEFTNLHTFP